MIELCSRRRMIICIIALVCLSIFVVILEAIFTPDTVHHATSLPPTDLNATTARPRCWHTEPFKVTTPCRPCTVLEKASGSIPECTRSTHVEQLLCEQFGRVFRGCDQAGQIARVRFLYFEGWMLVGSVASGVVVLLRQRHLERTALRRIQLQIAAGV